MDKDASWAISAPGEETAAWARLHGGGAAGCRVPNWDTARGGWSPTGGAVPSAGAKTAPCRPSIPPI